MSGGFDKYRCKYFQVQRCPNWVMVANAACSWCLAAGRESDTPPTGNECDIFVPCALDGTLNYVLMERVLSRSTNTWIIQYKDHHQYQLHQELQERARAHLSQDREQTEMHVGIVGTEPGAPPVLSTAGVHRAERERF